MEIESSKPEARSPQLSRTGITFVEFFFMNSFFKKNGLSIVFLLLFAFSIIGQVITGWHEHNKERKEEKIPTLNLSSYLSSGHFLQATFENWESEFLQMA